MVMEKKCSEEDLLCRSVVGFCCGCFDGFSSFWGLLSNARVGGGLLWGMKNCLLVSMEVAFFVLVSL